LTKARQVTALMAQVYASATSLTREEVQSLGGRLRQFMEYGSFPQYSYEAGEPNTFLASARTNLIPRIAADCQSLRLNP
jgi:hypothetical protein